jgi:hypothetical protein
MQASMPLGKSPMRLLVGAELGVYLLGEVDHVTQGNRI